MTACLCTRSRHVAAWAAVFALVGTSPLLADGTETLGDPSIPIAAGTDFVAAGTGLEEQPGTIDLTVPEDTDIAQVILYWSGATIGEDPGDDTIMVDGTEITGTLIGGPAFFFNCPEACEGGPGPVYHSAYRADITELELVGSGANSLSVEGLDFGFEDSGAGILAILDDGSAADSIGVRDGLDLAFINFASPRDATVPQTFTFPASDAERTADILLFASSVGGPNRPDRVTVETGGVTTEFQNVLASVDGPLWDTVTLEVTIPAEATELTVEVESVNDETDNTPASLAWIGAGFFVPAPPPPPPGQIGDFVWCDLDNDGMQDEGEPGIPGVSVHLTCAGPDGELGTGDDITDMRVTDEDGLYLFESVPPGLCEVTVDESTAGDDKVPGMCPLSVDVDLAPGEAFLDADFCFITPPAGGEGCTPGYWKQDHHFDSWPEGVSPDDPLSSVFMSPFDEEITLVEGLELRGGQVNALTRHAVAAYLNAASPDVDYGLSPSEVVEAYNETASSGDKDAIEELKDAFEDFNEQGCPLD